MEVGLWLEATVVLEFLKADNVWTARPGIVPSFWHLMSRIGRKPKAQLLHRYQCLFRSCRA